MSRHGISPPSIELFRTENFYIFIRENFSLWWDRTTGKFEAKTASDLVYAENPACLGILYGILGKIDLESTDVRLLLVRDFAHVGDLPGGHPVFKIKNVVFLPLKSDPGELGLEPCKMHQEIRNKRLGGPAGGLFDQKAMLGKTWGSIKSAGNTIKNTTQQAAALATMQVRSRRDSRDREKFERRILEELSRIFTETDSFYFSTTGDLTNSLQRLCDQEKVDNPSLLKNIDDRFFWNKHMLQDIININTALSEVWVVPIIQGFIQIESCQVDISRDAQVKYEPFVMTLISRRSRFRAGTRYKRRGVDEDGKCANYVETEQIVSHQSHQVSFVQVRGSVPVFWSQPGYKYRPPPRLDKGPVETKVAFEKHFEEELAVYGPVCVVNLMEHAGKERVIWEAYTDHILAYNSPQLTYASFDFHEYCRGMRFENVSVLVESLVDVLRDMGYCWRDHEGLICSQKGVFRVNCVDCLDRTNVVQTALAKAVMEIQFYKLGLIPPEGSVPASIRYTFQQLWANNGDIISKQYAGTSALKGDYTRTGERRLSGLMKDGVNSANRYYCGHFKDSYRQAVLDLMQGVRVAKEDVDVLNLVADEVEEVVAKRIPDVVLALPDHHFVYGPELSVAVEGARAARYYLSRFRDVYRQATIDIMLGLAVSEDELTDKNEEDISASAEPVKQIIDDCKRLLISDSSVVLGSWGLVDASPSSGDPNETDMDTILILTRDCYYMADYDVQIDRLTKYQRVPLEDITRLELGQADVSSSSSLFKSSTRNVHHVFRVHYRIDGQPGYYHMFRSAHLRFFNNVAVEIKSEEEMMESLKAVCETFVVALDIAGLPSIPVTTGHPLEKLKSRTVPRSSGHAGAGGLAGGLFANNDLPSLTRNSSESQLTALKNVGSKAISNVTTQFSKLNRLGDNLNPRHSSSSKTPLKNVSSNPPSQPSVSPVERERGHSSLSASTSPNRTPSISPSRSPSTSVRGAAAKTAQAPKSSQSSACVSHLPSVGIVMAHKLPLSTSQAEKVAEISEVSLSRVVAQETAASHTLRKYPLTHSRTDISLDVSRLPLTVVRGAPVEVAEVAEVAEEALEADGAVSSRLNPPNTLELAKEASGETGVPEERVSSDPDGAANITTSRSENSLRMLTDLSSAIASPVAAAAKEVLSPFSKLAKGLDVRRTRAGAGVPGFSLMGPGAGAGAGAASPRPSHQDEINALAERWKECDTKLIAL